ncbi:hypothetical protein MLD38_017562 [Melastoma candidum]|uniref:Uncharacterized protein n=1 Tax=Melastoma candidum TaxID=119954 RepID=A0ACB9QQY5_9MYRT|nr:hypothetical protein MLD38_017562 [Melastoma candidum]
METEVEIKATAEQFYEVFRARPHHLPTICSDIHTGEVKDGEWHVHGSSIHWTYHFGGKTEIYRNKAEYDDANMKVTYAGFEGDVFKRYKVYKAIWQCIPKSGGEGGIVKVAIDYEKLNEDVLSPDDYLAMLVGFTRDIDAHLSMA